MTPDLIRPTLRYYFLPLGTNTEGEELVRYSAAGHQGAEFWLHFHIVLCVRSRDVLIAPPAALILCNAI